MYPYGSLPENLAAFSAELRRRHGFRIGPRELQDAARALGAIRLGEERAVRNVLRPVLCGSKADVGVFDRAFDEFFHPSPGIPRSDRVVTEPGAARSGEEAVTRREAASRAAEAADREVADTAASSGVPNLQLVAEEATGGDAPEVLRASYSPLDAEGAPPDLRHPDASWRVAALAFVAALRIGMSRRWRPSPHGLRFDLRRTLRHSLHTGGEPVLPRWLARQRRRPRVVVIVDGSRSMGGHAQIALDLTVALAAATRDVEAFVFSTTLERVTRDVQRAAAGERRRLGRLQHAWGGGTSIGACLQAFLRRFGDRLLGRDTVLVVASDGLDIGDANVLRDAMTRLRRRSAAVIWLNPLLGTRGYAPTALGMVAARPYVSTFACVAGPAELLQLSRVVRVRV